jgi:hypothetical protein
LGRYADAARVFGLAVGRTTVAILLIAVVAHFANGRLDHAITAARSLLASSAGCRTDVTGLKLASVAAAITGLRVSVVAVLARLNALVAALGSQDAGLPRDALVARILNRAGGIAAIIVFCVAIVANFACTDIAVTADDVARTFALFGTRPILLDFADAIATVTGFGVAVVAFFDAALIVDSVAAALGYLFDASGGRIRAVAHRRRATPIAAGRFHRRVDDDPGAALAAATALARSSRVCPAVAS